MAESVLAGAVPASSPARRSLPLPLRAVFRIGGVLLPGLVARWVFGRMLRPSRRRLPGVERPVQVLTLEWNGQPLCIHRWGEQGPLAVLVHGWEGASGDFVALAESLHQRGWQVLAPDLPAHGRSAGLRTDVHEMAAGLSALLDQYGPAEVVIAHSLGAAVAAHCLRLHPGRIPRLALVAPGGDLEQELAQISGMLGLPARCRRALHRRAVAHYGCELRHCSTLAALQATQPVPEVLLLHDRHDRVVPFAQSLHLQKTLNCDLVASTGLGHRRILEDAEAIARITEFCGRFEAQSGTSPTAAHHSARTTG